MLRLSVPSFKADYFLSSNSLFQFHKEQHEDRPTPTVMGNCAREASRTAPPLGSIYVAAIIARAVSTATISLFQFMSVGLPFPFGTSRMGAIVHVFPGLGILSALHSFDKRLRWYMSQRNHRDL